MANTHVFILIKNEVEIISERLGDVLVSSYIILSCFLVRNVI